MSESSCVAALMELSQPSVPSTRSGPSTQVSSVLSVSSAPPAQGPSTQVILAPSASSVPPKSPTLPTIPALLSPSILPTVQSKRQRKRKYCTRCGKSYVRTDELAEHIASRHGNNLWMCPVDKCEKKLAFRTSVRKHIEQVASLCKNHRRFILDHPICPWKYAVPTNRAVYEAAKREAEEQTGFTRYSQPEYKNAEVDPMDTQDSTEEAEQFPSPTIPRSN